MALGSRPLVGREARRNAEKAADICNLFLERESNSQVPTILPSTASVGRVAGP